MLKRVNYKRNRGIFVKVNEKLKFDVIDQGWQKDSTVFTVKIVSKETRQPQRNSQC